MSKVLNTRDVSIIIKEQKQLKEGVTAFYIIAKRYPGDVPLTNNLFKENISNASIIQDVESLTGLTTISTKYLINPGTDVIGKEKQYLAFTELSASGVSAFITQKVAIPSTPQITKYDPAKAAVPDTYTINKVITGTDGIENLTCSAQTGTTLTACSVTNDTTAQTSTVQIIWTQDHGTTVAPPKVSYTKYTLSSSAETHDLTSYFTTPTKISGSAMVNDTYQLTSSTLTGVYNVDSMTCSGCTATPTVSCTGSGSSRVCKITANWQQTYGTTVSTPTNVSTWATLGSLISVNKSLISDTNWTNSSTTTGVVARVDGTYSYSNTWTTSVYGPYSVALTCPTNVSITSNLSSNASSFTYSGVVTNQYATSCCGTGYVTITPTVYSSCTTTQYCDTEIAASCSSCNIWDNPHNPYRRWCFNCTKSFSNLVSVTFDNNYTNWASRYSSWSNPWPTTDTDTSAACAQSGSSITCAKWMDYADKSDDVCYTVKICPTGTTTLSSVSKTCTQTSVGSPQLDQKVYTAGFTGVLSTGLTLTPTSDNTTSGTWTTSTTNLTLTQGTLNTTGSSSTVGTTAATTGVYKIIGTTTQQYRNGYSPNTTVAYSYYPITLNSSTSMPILSLSASSPTKTAGAAEVYDKYSITNFVWNNVQAISNFTCPTGWTCSFTRSGRNMLVSLAWSQSYNSALGQSATMTVTRNNPEVVSNGISTDKFGSATLVEGSYYVETVQQNVKSSLYYKQNKYLLASDIGDGATWGIVLDNSEQLANTPSDSLIYDSTYNGYSDWDGILRFIIYGISSSATTATSDGGLISATDSFGGIDAKLAKMIDEKIDNGMPLAKKSIMISENVRTTSGFGCNSARVLGSSGSYTNPGSVSDFENSTYLNGSGFNEGCIVTFKAMS